ncbi:bifunctional (p)ppGpp synthetase/guanosine-3',5'-bis(diphosphate) 3'-pyrophosphohydrolase [Aquiluna borgnonia]|uniref:Bifunctional (P)ppGpp synthetase/guanosine-3',5'-bis(Diphosphate) 3'-pyrophosphohydrolase n=1 Tax=Aquiluna borgnonia TaxID=2499157 RepID=A0A7D4UAS7_9MICO|nr:bifunctional (p)ppGpp synthetase/guanosine-3',5'-bis(diphosphate) 3'-pyrophosphohydrolase [Aquiluna borgnonia]QKJ25257.1 bifunctional (p)ppGpp synthetase/guanosine-3',5'-bis(diphosphate) 3'-pyrophosphohydrolase [Aquiluna borgnonia]
MTDSFASSLRSRLPRIFTRSSTAYGADLSELIKIVRINHPKSDYQVIERAYKTAEHYHEGQKRKSGEDYITHPLAVARILADLASGPATIAAALLHDTVEDTEYSIDKLRSDFGEEVALLVDGVTKLDKVKFGDSAQAETMRKMVVAMSKDVRVLVIKLADRLHNARTWGFVNPESAKRKAQETLEIYAPLAHRLGISTIKVELEDISFAVLYPKVYEEIVSLVSQRNPSRSEYTERVIDAIETELRDNRVKARISGRPKQYYSIYQKMVMRGREFDDIYDLVGIRVIVSSVRDCYAALGALHAKWSPLPGRFKDYIAMPKFNLYQSLHTTVVGPDGRAVEIQIRTQEMHQRAEFGVAAHWKYKTNTGKDGDQEVDFAWLKQLSDWQEETADPGEFLDNLRFEIGAKELYVFTPKGKVVGLSAGSTPVDFAYAVHTEVGHKTIGAKVNGRLVPLESKLQAGDVIEILTSKSESAGPSKDWLNFVGSPRARAKIKHWFTQERKELATEEGREALAKALRRQGLPIQSLLSSESLNQVAQELRLTDINGLFTAVGQGQVSAITIIERIKQLQGLGGDPDTEEIPVQQIPKSLRGPRHRSQGVLVKGSPDVLTKMARCCTPVPGDGIIGFITRGDGVSVHRSDCKNVKSLNAERVVEVSWAEDSRGVFMVQIQVEALDRSGLLSDVTRVLSENHVNILSATVSTSRDRIALNKFVFEMADPSHLDHLLNQVRRIEAVYDVYRVKST